MKCLRIAGLALALIAPVALVTTAVPASAAESVLYKEFGITAEAVAAAAKESIAKARG